METPGVRDARRAPRWRRALLTALVGLAASAHDAPAQEVPAQDVPATKTWSSSDGDVSIALPAAWDVESETPSPDDGGARLKLAIRPPDGGRRSLVWAYVRDDIRNVRGRMRFELPWHMKNYGARTNGRCDHPQPHFWTETGDDPARSVKHVYSIRHVRRVALVFVLEAPAPMWETVWRGFLEGVAAAGTKLEDAPERPAGVRPVEKGGHLYLLGKGVKHSTVETFHKRVAAVETAWSAVNGPLPRDPSNPVEIVIFDTQAQSDAAHVAAGWGPKSPTGSSCLARTGRILTWEFPAKDARAQADLTYALWRVFQAQAWDSEPRWFHEAVSYAAWLEAACGKPLPSIPADGLGTLPTTVPRFADLATAELPELNRDVEKERDALIGYLALFRLGAKKYQDAWNAFLDEMRATGDWTRAQKPLLALDQDLLRIDMELAFSKLKRIPSK